MVDVESPGKQFLLFTLKYSISNIQGERKKGVKWKDFKFLLDKLS